jgi:hypothetical protein
MSSVQRSERAAAFAPAAVGLTLFVGLAQLRMDDPWADGVLLLVALVPAVVVLALGLAAAGDGPDRGAATALLVAGLALAGIAIARLGDLLAGDDFTEGGGTLTWMLVLFTLLTAYCYRRSGSVACLLIASLAAVGLLLEAVNWIFDTEDRDVFRALLAFSFVVLFLAGLAGSGRPATILIAAAGVTVIVSSYVLGFFFSFVPGGPDSPWGWELVTLIEGLALLAYAVVALEPGPGYLAFFVLAIFVTVAVTGGNTALGGDGEAAHTLVGWPLAIGIGTALAAVWGARRVPAG